MDFNINNFFDNNSKQTKIGDFQDLDHIDGVGISTVSAGLYEKKRDDLVLFYFRDGANYASVFTKSKTISENIRKQIGFFSDVLTLKEEEIDQLLNEVDTNTLSYALVGCDEEISQKLFKSLSDAGKNALKRKITLLEDGDSRMIEESRKKIGESILKITMTE